MAASPRCFRPAARASVVAGGATPWAIDGRGASGRSHAARSKEEKRALNRMLNVQRCSGFPAAGGEGACGPSTGAAAGALGGLTGDLGRLIAGCGGAATAASRAPDVRGSRRLTDGYGVTVTIEGGDLL